MLSYLIFSDGTSSGDSDWTVKSGSFRINKAGEYQSTAGKNNVSLVKSLLEKPYPFSVGRIEVDLRLDNTKKYTPRAGVLFGYQNNLKYRFVQLRPDGILFGQKGRIGTSPAISRFKAVRIKKGVTYTLRIDLRSDRKMQVYLGNRLLSTYRFKSMPSGAVGLYSPESRAFFDNVHIWGASIFD